MLFGTRSLRKSEDFMASMSARLCGADENFKYPSTFGQRIFEVHHLSPLSKAATPVRTTLDDLAILCANCHRAVHATAEVEANYKSLAAHMGHES